MHGNQEPAGAATDTAVSIDANSQSQEPNVAQGVFGSGSTTEPHSQADVSQPNGTSSADPTPTQGQQQAPQQQMTPEQIAQIASQTALQQQQLAQQQAQQQQANQPRQYTAEELNAYQADEAVFNRIFGSEDPKEAVAALNEFAQGIAKQAFTMAQLYANDAFSQKFEAFQNQVNPYMEFANQQQELAMQQQFFGSHPTLKGQEVVVQQVLSAMRQEGFQAQNQQQLFQEVANRTQAIINHISGGQAPQGQVGQGQTPLQGQVAQQTQQKPGMATVGAGGTGGAGGGQGAGSGSPSAAKSIFG